MKKTNSEQVNVQVEPKFETLSMFMTYHLLKGIAWTEAFPKAKAFADKKERTYADATLRGWRGHATWLKGSGRGHNFDLDLENDGQHGQVVHKSSRRPLTQEEINKLIEETYRKKSGLPAPGRVSPSTDPKYEPKDYDIGDGSSYVYAYYYPEYRKKRGGSFKIKVGRSVDYRGRIADQSRATGMPEEIEVAVLWRTDKPEAAEKLLHDHLKFRGKHVPDAPGREWFLTSPDEIRQIIECIQPGVRIRNIATAKES